MAEGDDYKYKYVTSGTTQVKTGKGFLHSIIVGTTTGTAFQIIDGTAGSVTNLGEIKSNASEGVYFFDCVFAAGLRTISGAGTYTIVYR